MDGGRVRAAPPPTRGDPWRSTPGSTDAEREGDPERPVPASMQRGTHGPLFRVTLLTL
jgi:hypothetical protein